MLDDTQTNAEYTTYATNYTGRQVNVSAFLIDKRHFGVSNNGVQAVRRKSLMLRHIESSIGSDVKL
jgi:hypothetical protein